MWITASINIYIFIYFTKTLWNLCQIFAKSLTKFDSTTHPTDSNNTILSTLVEWSTLGKTRLKRSWKSYQSLKACNFLNNGPIFNPQKVLESSWSPLSVGDSVHKTNSLAHLVSPWSLTRIGLWTPPSPLSLKACNFLNNGPIFNPQKVLESSWSPLSAGGVQNVVVSIRQTLSYISFPPEVSRDLTKGHQRHHTKQLNQQKTAYWWCP